MFHLLEQRISAAITARLETMGVDVPVTVEQPKQTSFGEAAIPAAFQLARQLKKPPKAIAAELAEGLTIPGVGAIEIAGNGYLNLRFDRGEFGKALIGQAGELAASITPGKTIVEHTNINPNKAAHIGHLRNAILGDTFVRMLRRAGHHVEAQNYIDNTGVQVADVVVGFIHLEHKTTAEVRELIETERFDYYCWELYARTSQYYADHPEALEWRKAALHAIEHGTGETAEMAHLVADAIVVAHLATMYRLNIEYDVLPRESEILHLQFWATAFELLKERKAIYFENEGKNKGCWVMPASAFRRGSKDEAPAEDSKDEAPAEDSTAEVDSKVIVRSNGTVTYVGKDIAYQLWKFGLLGSEESRKDFFYRLWHTYPGGHKVWVSTDVEHAETPQFGGGERVYNVIDSRQSYLQDVVVAGLRALGFDKQAEASVHFSYEMVALSPRTCVEMGIELSEEDKRRPYVEVSGRKGLGVKADDLIDKLIETALREVQSRNADKPIAENRRAAGIIAVGALRYFMLKYTRNSVIAFDFAGALAFTGETGVYVQYQARRASKLVSETELPDFATLSSEAIGQQLSDENLWQYLLEASRAESALAKALASGEPSHVARYAFQLAQAFASFYELFPVLKAPNPEARYFRLWMVTYFLKQLESTLEVLGIEVPEYM